jgi:hypothetical protein
MWGPYHWYFYVLGWPCYDLSINLVGCTKCGDRTSHVCWWAILAMCLSILLFAPSPTPPPREGLPCHCPCHVTVWHEPHPTGGDRLMGCPAPCVSCAARSLCPYLVCRSVRTLRSVRCSSVYLESSIHESLQACAPTWLGKRCSWLCRSVQVCAGLCMCRMYILLVYIDLIPYCVGSVCLWRLCWRCLLTIRSGTWRYLSVCKQHLYWELLPGTMVSSSARGNIYLCYLMIALEERMLLLAYSSCYSIAGGWLMTAMLSC